MTQEQEQELKDRVRVVVETIDSEIAAAGIGLRSQAADSIRWRVCGAVASRLVSIPLDDVRTLAQYEVGRRGRKPPC